MANLQPRVNIPPNPVTGGLRAPGGSQSPRQFNPVQGLFGSLQGGGGFNKLAAGTKTYGMGRSAPNVGRTQDKSGYNQREVRNAARRDALLERAQQYGG